MISGFDIFQGAGFDEILVFVQEYQYIIAILTPLIVGEISIHMLGVLQGSGNITIVPFLLSFVSVVIFESFIYYIARFFGDRVRFGALTRRFPMLEGVASGFRRYSRQFRDHTLLLLFVMKALPLTKILIFLFGVRYRIPLLSFILKNSIVTLIWALALYIPGVLVGANFLSRESDRSVGAFLLYFFLVALLLLIFGRHLERFVLFLARKALHLFSCLKRCFRKRCDDVA